MWINPEDVVKETEKASKAGKTEIIPGKVYKITKPFLRFESAINVWKKITKRN